MDLPCLVPYKEAQKAKNEQAQNQILLDLLRRGILNNHLGEMYLAEHGENDERNELSVSYHALGLYPVSGK